MEVVGGVAAVTQLVAHSIEGAQLLHEAYRSFKDAPEELKTLGTTLGAVTQRVQQIQQWSNDVSETAMAELFEPQHIVELVETLKKSTDLGQKLKNVRRSKQSSGFRSRLSWTMFDKRRSKAIMEEIKDLETSLSFTLQTFDVRSGTLTQRGVEAIRASHDLGLAALGRVQLTADETLQLLAKHIISQETHWAQHNKQYEQMVVSMQQTLSEDRTLPVYSKEERGDAFGRLSKENIHPKTTDKASLETSNLETQLQGASFRYPFGNKKMSKWVWRTQLGKTDSEAVNLFDDEPVSTNHADAGLQLKRENWGEMTTRRAKVNLQLFGAIALQAEIRIKTRAQSWLPIPNIRTSLSPVNILPVTAPIVIAINQLDIEAITYLLESGESSIHDVDELGFTLLRRLFSHYTFRSRKNKGEAAIEGVLSYLLAKGCDPDAEMDPDSRTLFSNTLQSKDTRIPEILARRGADTQLSPGNYARLARQAMSRPEMDLLQSCDLLKWSNTDLDEQIRRSIFLSFCRFGDMELLMRRVKEYGLPEPSSRSLFWSIEQLLGWGHSQLVMTTILFEYLRNHTKLSKAERSSGLGAVLTSLLRGDYPCWSGAHLLLLQHAALEKSKDGILLSCFSQGQAFIFDHEVKLALHLLLHGASCHLSRFDLEQLGQSARNKTTAKRPSDDPSPQHGLTRTEWTENGVILLDGLVGRVNASHVSVRPISELVEDSDSSSWLHLRSPDISNACMFAGDDGRDGNGSLDADLETETEDAYDPQVSIDDLQAIRREFFQQGPLKSSAMYVFLQGRCDAAHLPLEFEARERLGFHRQISTKQGRRQLAKYPRLTVYYTALRLAGYEAEMDDAGDIWWSDDDCEPYVDAREDQPFEDEDDSLEANCPMCREPKAWGLEGIQQRMTKTQETFRRFHEGERQQVRWPKTYGGQHSGNIVQKL